MLDKRCLVAQTGSRGISIPCRLPDLRAMVFQLMPRHRQVRFGQWRAICAIRLVASRNEALPRGVRLGRPRERRDARTQQYNDASLSLRQDQISVSKFNFARPSIWSQPYLRITGIAKPSLFSSRRSTPRLQITQIDQVCPLFGSLDRLASIRVRFPRRPSLPAFVEPLRIASGVGRSPRLRLRSSMNPPIRILSVSPKGLSQTGTAEGAGSPAPLGARFHRSSVDACQTVGVNRHRLRPDAQLCASASDLGGYVSRHPANHADTLHLLGLLSLQAEHFARLPVTEWVTRANHQLGVGASNPASRPTSAISC